MAKGVLQTDTLFTPAPAYRDRSSSSSSTFGISLIPNKESMGPLTAYMIAFPVHLQPSYTLLTPYQNLQGCFCLRLKPPLDLATK